MGQKQNSDDGLLFILNRLGTMVTMLHEMTMETMDAGECIEESEMKRKLFFLWAAVLLVCPQLGAQQIQNVTIGYEMPNEGPFPSGKVFHDDTVIIRWDKINVNGNVSIELYRQNHSLALVIAPSYPVGDLPKSWRVASTIVPGNYSIKVSQGSVSGSSPVFAVKGPRSISGVAVFLEGQPTPSFFQAGQTISIRWNAHLLGTVRVLLRAVASKAFHVVSEGRPYNDIPASFKLPLKMKGKFQVEVSQGKIKSLSKPFTVKNRGLLTPVQRIRKKTHEQT